MTESVLSVTNAKPLPNCFKVELLLECDLKTKLGGDEKCPFVRSAADVARTFEDLRTLEREVLVVGALNCQCQLLCWSLAALGTSEMVSVRVADIFRNPVRCGAVSIFLVHNHPSGSLKISVADIDMTRIVAEAGSTLGIQLIDHIVLTRKAHKSIMTPGILGRLQATVPMVVANEHSVHAVPRWHCNRCDTENELCAYYAAPRKDFCTLVRCAKCNASAWLRTSANPCSSARPATTLNLANRSAT